MLYGRSRQLLCNDGERIRKAKPKLLKESLAKTLYDLVRAPQFVPFSILFASGQRFEIKTREHIGLGPVSRADVEELKAVIVWDDTGEAFTCRQSLRLNDRNLEMPLPLSR
jgi:hypothetical protein